MIVQLLNAVGSNTSPTNVAARPIDAPVAGTGQVVATSEFKRREAIFQVNFSTTTGSATMTVLLQGSLDNQNWVTIQTYTNVNTLAASQADVVARFPFMRAAMTSWTSGTATAYLDMN